MSGSTFVERARVDAMLAYAYGSAAAGFAATGLELLPGVKELLERLAERDDCVVALVTGAVFAGVLC